jgi:hypothetical protein
MRKRATIKRRGFLAAAFGAMTGAFISGKSPTAVAQSGLGDQGNFVLGSNNFFRAPATFTNRANISSVSTALEASPNFGNFITASPACVMSLDAGPASGDIRALDAYGSGNEAAIRAFGEEGGIGVDARGNIGVYAAGDAWGVRSECTTGRAVSGISDEGIGGFFQGAQAALRLASTSTTGPPTTGAHAPGEFVVDVTGNLYYCRSGGTPGTWVGLSAAPVFRTLPSPERFVDTRIGLGGVQGPLPGGTTRTYQMTGRDGQSGNASLRIPDSATTLVGNLTVLGGPNIPVGSFVTVWPGGPLPTVSNINLGPGAVVANTFVVGMTNVAGHGNVDVFNQQQCDYILDVTGYYM